MRLSRSIPLVATISSSSSSPSLSCALSRSFSTSCGDDGSPLWRHVTVEWSPKLSQTIQSQPNLPSAATHWVFPDLPQLYTQEHRLAYWKNTLPQQRIQTVAACRHQDWKSLIDAANERLRGMSDQGVNHPGGKLLLVGGNDKTAQTMSTVQAATILQSELGDNSISAELWAVADPNDPESVAKVQSKVEAGIVGFVTQPLLTSTAWDTIELYRNHHPNITLVVGVALPRSASNLQFWRQLLDRPDLLDHDPLFQSHLAYFSQPYTTSLAWIGRELQQCITYSSMIDGVHFMPLHNTKDMMTLFHTLAVQNQQKQQHAEEQ